MGLSTKASLEYFAVEPPIEPAVAPWSEPLRRRHPGSHHHRMAAAKLLQDRIVLKPKGGELIQYRLRWRRGVPVINLGLLLLLDQHSLRVLDPPVVKDLRHRRDQPFARPALQILSG